MRSRPCRPNIPTARRPSNTRTPAQQVDTATLPSRSNRPTPRAPRQPNTHTLLLQYLNIFIPTIPKPALDIRTVGLPRPSQVRLSHRLFLFTNHFHHNRRFFTSRFCLSSSRPGRTEPQTLFTQRSPHRTLGHTSHSAPSLVNSRKTFYADLYITVFKWAFFRFYLLSFFFLLSFFSFLGSTFHFYRRKEATLKGKVGLTTSPATVRDEMEGCPVWP